MFTGRVNCCSSGCSNEKCPRKKRLRKEERISEWPNFFDSPSMETIDAGMDTLLKKMFFPASGFVESAVVSQEDNNLCSRLKKRNQKLF